MQNIPLHNSPSLPGLDWLYGALLAHGDVGDALNESPVVMEGLLKFNSVPGGVNCWYYKTTSVKLAKCQNLMIYKWWWWASCEDEGVGGDILLYTLIMHTRQWHTLISSPPISTLCLPFYHEKNAEIVFFWTFRPAEWNATMTSTKPKHKRDEDDLAWGPKGR